MRTKFTNAGQLITNKAPQEKRTEITKKYNSGEYTIFDLYKMYPGYGPFIDKLDAQD